MHYGSGRWLVVDSCLEHDETPSALSYLSRIGIDPAKSVSHVVITHPDGDHLGGITRVFEACASARLVCPAALSDRDMLAYITFYAQRDPSALASNTREVYELLERSVDRGGPIYASQDRLLIDDGDTTIAALAPSDRKLGKFLKHIANALPKYRDDRTAAPALVPNDVSAAVILKRTEFSIILGADLQETPGKGWQTIIDDSLIYKSSPPAVVYKVPHHGSSDGDCPALWARMASPVAVLAPFKRGSVKLPAPTDVTRILGYTTNAHSTAGFKNQKVRRLSRVDKILYRHGIKNRELYPKNGHIRLRVRNSGTVFVDRFAGAIHLSDVH